MTMTIPAATARLGREVAEAHLQVDQALVSVAALFHSAAIARADIVDADPRLGQGALQRMHRGLGGLLTVRADILRAHGALRDDLQVVSGAEEPTCPDYIRKSGQLDADRNAA